MRQTLILLESRPAAFLGTKVPFYKKRSCGPSQKAHLPSYKAKCRLQS